MKANAQEWNKIWASQSVSYKVLSYMREILTRDLYRKLFKRYLNKNTTLLEVGCGSSTTSLYLAKKIKSITGLDISDEALNLSRQKAKHLNVKNASFVKGSCFKIPFKDNTFDIVWSQGLIEHFDNPQDIINEKIRVCKRNGIIITCVPAFWSYHKPWYLLTRPSILRRFWLWTDQTFYTKKMFNALITDKVKHIRTFHYPKYGMLVQILKKV